MHGASARTSVGLGLMATLAACDFATAPAGVEPGGSTAPLVVVAHAGTAPGEAGKGSGPVLVVGQPSLVGGTAPAVRPSPTPVPSPTPSPSPKPTATPAPTPQPLEFSSFLIRVPPGWKVVTAQTRPVNLRLTPEAGPGAFWVMEEDGSALPLETRQAQARTAAGDGFVSQSTPVLDEVRGFQVNSNQDTALGKRYVAERGFLYRGRFWRVVSEWDKRAEATPQIEKDVAAILKSWRWL